jgi:hypothetical protein
MGCIIVYIITQGLIAIIDLLSRIERNTRAWWEMGAFGADGKDWVVEDQYS